MRIFSVQQLFFVKPPTVRKRAATFHSSMSPIMLSFAIFFSYAECHYAECHYAECHYAECHYAECHYAECHYAECNYAECCYAECNYAQCRGALLSASSYHLTFRSCKISENGEQFCKDPESVQQNAYKHKFFPFNFVHIMFSCQ